MQNKKQNKKIAIIIDDEKLIRQLLGTILTSLGYETSIYSSALDVPCINNNEPVHCPNELKIPDLLISDIKMPGLSGIDFIKQIKKNGCKIKKIALMTGFSNLNLTEICESLGCKAFHKPFTVNQIKEWIED